MTERPNGWEAPQGFEALMDAVRENSPESIAPGSQTIAVETVNRAIFCRTIANAAVDGSADEAALTEELRSLCDTLVSKIVCVWHDGTPDLPSMNFRRTLLALNPKNAEAQILLKGAAGWIVKPLNTTIRK